MSLVTVPQVNPNDEVTALSVNQGPNAIAAVVNGNIDDANVSTLSGTKISAGTLPASASDIASNPETREAETLGDLVASGLIWTTLTGLNGTMTAGVIYINGKRLAINTIASYAFIASRDTYVYIDSTGSVQYNPQINGAAQPATPPNNQIIAKIVTNGSIVTSILDLRLLSIVSSWQIWVPTVSAASGTFTSVSAPNCSYKRIGKTIFVNFQINVTTVGTASGAVRFTLPFAPNLTGGAGWVGSGREDAVTGKQVQCIVKSGSIVEVFFYDNTGSTAATSGAVHRGSLTYESI